jgi:hypothetical protein
MLIFPALGRLKQENCEFEGNLGFIGKHSLHKSKKFLQIKEK